MKIEKIELFAIELPLIDPFVVSYARYDSMPSIIIKMTTDDGIVGYGEGVPDEHVTGETVESTFHVLKSGIAPKLIGKDPMDIELIHEIMDETVYGVPTAKAAIDISCYDLAGKKLGVPIYKLLGGQYHDTFPLTRVLSIDTPLNMADEAEKYLTKGYTSFKIKVGTNVVEDVERIKSVRKRLGDDISIRVDVNQGWKTSANALRAIRMLKDVSLDWIEQPVNAEDIDAMAEIKGKSSIPVMIDEGLQGKKTMREIINKNAADMVNIKLMKCGGIYPGLKLTHMAEMANIEVQIGSMVESSIASAAGLHLAFSKKNITSMELTGPLKFAKDVGNLKYDVPYVNIPDKPGLGIDVDEEVLHELAMYSDRVL